jgi:hypothetical protein
MPYQQFAENYQTFSHLIDELKTKKSQSLDLLISAFMKQNVILLNNILQNSIDHLEKLNRANSMGEAILAETQFIQSMNKVLNESTQQLLDISLEKIGDVNEQLISQCDLATD